MKTTIANLRSRGAAFLRLRDTVLVELGLALTALLNARLVDTTMGGRPLAPFTESALDFLAIPNLIWVVGLSVVGVVKIFALALGLWCEHRNIPHRYLGLRAGVSLLATFAWATLLVAVYTANQPTVITLRYVLPCVFSIATFLALALQHKAFKDDEDGRLSAQICRQCQHEVEHEINRTQHDARERFRQQFSFEPSSTPWI